MKTFILNNKRSLLLIIFVVIMIILFHVFDDTEEKKSNDIIEYSSIKEGDIIPFNSRIVGEFNLYMKFESHDKEVNHYITSKFIKANHTNIYYCKSDNCLNNNEYSLTKNYYKVGNSTLFDYNVSNYEEIFSKKNDKYTGWEVHFLPFTYYNENFHTMYIGTYYDLVLIPTSKTKNDCLNNIDNYGKSNKYEIIDNSNTWKIDNNNFYLDKNTKGYIDIEFDAKVGDQIIFDLNTSSTSLKIYLNDEENTGMLQLYDYDKLFRYKTIIINVTHNDKYIMHIEDDATKENDTDMFDKFVNIKNFNVFSPSKKEKSNIFYTKCDGDFIIGEVNE